MLHRAVSVRLSLTQTYISLFFFFFNDTAPTEIYTLSLHDALPIYRPETHLSDEQQRKSERRPTQHRLAAIDRKSTRLNSSHVEISYAVFCLKKKKKNKAKDTYRPFFLVP